MGPQQAHGKLKIQHAKMNVSKIETQPVRGQTTIRTFQKRLEQTQTEKEKSSDACNFSCTSHGHDTM